MENTCQFDEAWVGKCKKELGSFIYCDKHIHIKCSVCGEQATHTCAETFQFVCGSPLCGKEECKIKHHASFYKFTPQRWAELFKLEVNEEMFGGLWTREIDVKDFKRLATRDIVRGITVELALGLGTHPMNNQIESSDYHPDMIIIKLKNGLTIGYKAEVW